MKWQTIVNWEINKTQSLLAIGTLHNFSDFWSIFLFLVTEKSMLSAKILQEGVIFVITN
jgi:hypothetical protein